MGSGIDRVLVAKVGAVAFAWALTVPTVLSGAAARTEAVSVASVVSDDLVAIVDILETPATTTVLRGVSSSIADLADIPQLPTRTAVLAHTASAVVEPAPRAAPLSSRWATVPGPEAYVRDGVVLASWYGPRFYGRKTACGQTYTPEILGVAHRVLRCGTKIQITSPAGITLTVPVIDRGPYIVGRALDLSNATRIALACRDLCRVGMVVLE